jgi:tetratricopeptide (TPR) repeat protein
MDLASRTAMELHFADNFETRLFPVLADHYLKDGDLERAKKVCKIGLEYHPENADGLYILGQANRNNGDLQKAEQSFKSVLQNGTVHLLAATGLAEIQSELDRSNASLLKTWQQVLKWDPGNKSAREWVDNHTAKEPPRKIKKKSTKKASPQKNNERFEISSKLATFTMIAVLRNQGLYHQALAVLDLLEKKGTDKKRIQSEKQELLTMMEE